MSESRVETSVVLPTYNEKELIEAMVDEVFKHVRDVEVIVVDDDSPDGTWQIIERMQAARPTLRLVRRTTEKGVASAILTGVRASKGKYVVWMDADLCMPPSLIPEMVSGMGQYDVVIGSRYASGGKDARTLGRIATSWALNAVASTILFTRRVRDWTTGFVCVKREVFEAVGGFDARGHGEYCIEFLWKCLRHKYKVKEIGYVFTDRAAGESKTASHKLSMIRHMFAYGWRVLRMRFAVS